MYLELRNCNHFDINKSHLVGGRSEEVFQNQGKVSDI